jgi:glycosyltransferase involved in cell wall biosynthesis
LISVALPVIKTKFFQDALQSVLNQSFDDFELIIVNNGSKEDVLSIVNNYSDPRIKYIEHQEMFPVIENWNKCLSYAKGDYFVLFSDDDIYEKDFLKELNGLTLKFPNVNIFHTRVKVIDENNETVCYTVSCPEFESIADFIWHRVKSYRMHYAPDFMCKTEKLRDIGGFVDLPNAWGSDDATWFLMANENGIVSSPKILCNWRQSNINLSRKGSVESKLIAVTSFMKWLENFIENVMKVNKDENELLIQIRKNLKQRYGVIQAAALKLGINSKGNQYINFIFNWLKFRNKYSLHLFSLIWGLMLIGKDSKDNNTIVKI